MAGPVGNAANRGSRCLLADVKVVKSMVKLTAAQAIDYKTIDSELAVDNIDANTV